MDKQELNNILYGILYEQQEQIQYADEEEEQWRIKNIRALELAISLASNAKEEYIR